MRIRVGDIALFVEVIGRKVADREDIEGERPTILLLHGGPGWDHRTLLADYTSLADAAQLIFYDHRGLGRSDRAAPESWTLDRWAADLAALIDALGLERPVILGQSFGGMVAQRFAIDHPGRASGYILLSTSARFDADIAADAFAARGGPELRALASAFFTAAGAEARDRFLREALPYYTASGSPPVSHIPFDPAVLDHFFSSAGDAHRFDHRHSLRAVDVPVLIIGGRLDPVIPPPMLSELAAAFEPRLVDLHILDDCGHGPARDKPIETHGLIREFLATKVEKP